MKKFVALILVSLCCINASQADVWAERQALAKIESELAALESLILAAKGQSNSEDRMTFDYRALLADVKKIRSGISHHLTVPMEPVVPSTIDALSSDYTAYQR